MRGNVLRKRPLVCINCWMTPSQSLQTQVHVLPQLHFVHSPLMCLSAADSAKPRNPQKQNLSTPGIAAMHRAKKTLQHRDCPRNSTVECQVMCYKATVGMNQMVYLTATVAPSSDPCVPQILLCAISFHVSFGCRLCGTETVHSCVQSTAHRRTGRINRFGPREAGDSEMWQGATGRRQGGNRKMTGLRQEDNRPAAGKRQGSDRKRQSGNRKATRELRQEGNSEVTGRRQGGGRETTGKQQEQDIATG